MAWTTAMLERQTKLPELDKLLGGSGTKRRKTGMIPTLMQFPHVKVVGG